MSINQVILSGHLGSKPQGHLVKNGNAFVTLSLATNEHYKNAKGKLVKKTQWNKIIANGGVADIAERLDVGCRVLVLGKLDDVKWTDKNGVEHVTKQVIASRIEDISNKFVTEASHNEDSHSTDAVEEEPYEPPYRGKATSKRPTSTHQRTQSAYRKSPAR